jgi:hypothetical protein
MTTRALNVRLEKLEDRCPPQAEGLWAVLRWRFPVPGRGGHVCDRTWGWELRDRLGLGSPPSLLAIVEEGGEVPEVIVQPCTGPEMLAGDVGRLESAIHAQRPAWLLEIRGAFVFGQEMPNGALEWFEEARKLLEADK